MKFLMTKKENKYYNIDHEDNKKIVNKYSFMS